MAALGHRNESKPSPNHAAIDRWNAESAALAAELQGLDVRDHERVERVCREYGAEIKRLDALEAARESADG